MENFLHIAIVGVALSGTIQYIKTRFGTTGIGTKFITLGLALIVGTGVYLLQDTSYWETIIGVLGSASVVYAFFMK